MTFETKLKAANTQIKASSIRLYLQNVKRLYRMLKPDATDLPEGGDWLNKSEIFTKLEKIPVNKRRHLTLSGLKAAYAYKLPKKNNRKMVC